MSSPTCNCSDICDGSCLKLFRKKNEKIWDPLIKEKRPKTATTSTTQTAPTDDRYNMNYEKRGIALIFNHENFDNGHPKRDGTNKDCNRLHQTLSNIGFDVIIYKNSTLKEFQEILEMWAKSKEHWKSDCFAVVVLSHGDVDRIFTSDGKSYHPTVFIKMFSGSNCPALAGKPKIVIIATCGGDQRDRGVNLRVGRTETDSISPGISYSVPSDSHFLYFYSCSRGTPSFRNPVKGSYFIQTLCDQLDKYWFSKQLTSIFLIVNRSIAIDFTSTSGHKQTPVYVNSLLHELWFTIKPDMNDNSPNPNVQ